MHSQADTDTQHLLGTAQDCGQLPPATRMEKSNQSYPIAISGNPKSISPLRSALRFFWFRHFEGTWILELIGLLCSAAGLIAIAIILLKYDGKQRPSWAISVNAVVSILSAIVSIGALYSVTHAVNQLKWVWFSEKERKLADIQVFDGGSRGVVGAMTLLLHLRAR
jgi:hypothetical protein